MGATAAVIAIACVSAISHPVLEGDCGSVTSAAKNLVADRHKSNNWIGGCTRDGCGVDWCCLANGEICMHLTDLTGFLV